MKEYNEEDIQDIQIVNEHPADEIFSPKSFLETRTEKDRERLERHARINAGFHDFEESSFVSKKTIRDLCVQYRVFFENDPKFSKFLEQMLAYADLDPYTHDNYLKEQEFVKGLPAMIDSLLEELDKQEQAFIKNEINISKDAYNALPAKEKENYDKNITLKEETFDNRKRALATFYQYFENMSRGSLQDQDFFSDEIKADIELENQKKELTQLRFEHNGQTCYYINSVGVKMGAKVDREDLDFFDRRQADIGDLTATTKDFSNKPIFPHEPRMTDVAQEFSGECYLYSALQDIARLYPNKIKEMIRDNNDGTATVRLYARVTDGITKKNEYRPVYVRVDKKIPKMGLGLYDRLGVDCLWVNLIEKAYIMSGLNKTTSGEENIPFHPKREEFKNWKPRVTDIEGGIADRFLHNLLGPLAVTKKIKIPDIRDLQNPKKSSTFFDKVKRAVDKGLPVACSTYGDDKEVNYTASRHAYSIIGAYKTDTDPVEYYFRVKNPMTKVTSENALKYEDKGTHYAAKWVNEKDGIFDIRLDEFVQDYDKLVICGDKDLTKEVHQKTVGYDVISDEDIAKYEKDTITSDKLTDLMKTANDFYDAMVSTNSAYSKDSEQYKDLVEGIKVFRHQLATSNGRPVADLKDLTEPLLQLVEAYEGHVNEKKSPSRRQTRRLSVCSDIHKVTEAMNAGRNPEAEYEQAYAKKLMTAYYANIKKPLPLDIDEISDRLYNNKAFRNIANTTSITCMDKPSSSQMKEHLKQIETALKGRGRDAGINLATMQPEKESAPIGTKAVMPRKK